MTDADRVGASGARRLRSLGRLISSLLHVFLLPLPALALDSSVLVSEVIPYSLVADTGYLIPVTIRNTGNTTWTETGGYRLGSQRPADNITWGVSRVDLSGTDAVSPGETKTFYVNVTTPDTPADTYVFQWRMIKGDTGWFGDSSSYRTIAVFCVGAPAETVSVLDFFLSDHLANGLTGPHAQSQTVNGRWTAYVKWDSSAIESFLWDRTYIYEREDHTMPAGTPHYLLEPGKWMKLRMALGDTIDQRDNMAYWYDNSWKCTLTGTYAPKNHPYIVTLEAHLPSVDFGGDIGVQDVIVLKYDYFYNYEKFYYSREWGWILWEWYSPQNKVHQQSLFNRTGGAAVAPGPEYTAQTVEVFETSDSRTMTVNAYFGAQSLAVESNTFGESVIIVAYVPPTPYLSGPAFSGTNAGYTDLGLKITVDTPAVPLKKARLTMTWRDQDVIGFDENRFVLGERDDTTGTWRAVATTLDTAANRLAASTTVPGLFQIFELNSTTSDSTWHVNSATGSDTAAGSVASPFRSIRKALSVAADGETVRIAAGTYAETVAFTRDGVILSGTDSSGTIIDMNDSSAGTGLTGIRATGRRRIQIRDLMVRDVYRGILLSNVDSSALERVSVQAVGYRGVELASGSSGNALRQCSVTNAGDNGIFIDASDSNDLLGNTTSRNSGSGIVLWGSDTNLLSGNRSESNGFIGIYLGSGSDSNRVEGNTAVANASVGLHVNDSDTNLLSDNILSRNLRNLSLAAAHGNVFRNNLSLASTDNGVIIESQSSGNLFDSNVVSGSTWSGFGLIAANRNTFTGNDVSSNGANGFYLLNASTGNVILRNRIHSNAEYGVRLDSASANGFHQNTIDSNANYALCMTGSSGSDTFTRNNISPNPAQTTRGVLNATATAFDFTLNWWGTTDSATIAARISNTGGGSIRATGFRLGPVDTASSADTVAPASPSVTSVDTQYAAIRVFFDAPGANEDGHAGAPGVVSYRLYRSRNPAPFDWGNPVVTGTASPLVDTQALADTIYYYTVTARDGAFLVNESFYSGLIEGGPTSRRAGDFTGDAQVAVDDLLMLTSLYRIPALYNVLYDVGRNGVDNIIDFEDIAEFGRRYGQ